MMSEREIRKVVAETLTRLGYKDRTPRSVSDALVYKIMAAFITGQFAVSLEYEPSDKQAPELLGRYVEFIAYTDMSNPNRRKSSKRRAAAA